jgi:hypothetical protein
MMGAKTWKKGLRLEGVCSRTFETQNGTCFEITLRNPTKVNGALEKKVSIGALKGFHMALNAAGLETLEVGDKVIIECTGTTETSKGNPRVDFNLAVDRPD